MNNDETKQSVLRARLVTGAVVIALATAALVYREVLVAWFTGQPIGQHEGQALSVHQGQLSLRAALEPDPPRTSGNSLLLRVTDAEGQPATDAKVEVEYQMPAMGAMAEMKGRAEVTAGKPGEYRANFDLPMAGSWTLKTSVSTSNAHAAQDFSLTVGTEGLRTGSGSDESASTADNDGIDHYTCSMHPSVHQSTPGKCPICGMDLIAVTKEQQAQGVVTISPVRHQLIGVRTAPVYEGNFVRSLRAVGRLSYDESKLTEVNLKVRGWIVKLFATNTGQRVERGEPLFTLYSPELYNAQQDFLLATRGQESMQRDNTTLAQSARQRLRLLDVSDVQIDELVRRGQPLENVTFNARSSGFVIEKNVVEGAAVEPGMRLYRIAALDKVWIEADVYEADLVSVRIGQKASVTLDYLPDRSYEARVAYVYPYLNTETRTGRVRLELANRKLELRPGMYANVELEADLGKQLQVPTSAIVYTGPRRLVFVDLGEGRFRPQEVKVGAAANGMHVVSSGLNAGDRVATSGVFLIAAEARISTAAKYWDGAPPADVDTHEPQSPPEPMHVAPAGAAGASSNAPKLNASEAQTATYTCPMHPEVKSPNPGACPKCGMDLVREAP